MKRKLILGCLLLLCLLGTAVTSALAAFPGDTVDVVISVKENPDKAFAGNIAYDYDKTVFEFVRADAISTDVIVDTSEGELPTGGYFTADVDFALLDVSGIKAGDKVTVKLKIKEGAASGTYPIQLIASDFVNMSEKTVTVELAEVKIVVGCTSHIWDDGEITTPATCKAEGVKTYTCTNHGCEATKTEPVAKLTTHTPAAAVRENEVAATCQAAGSYDEVVYCSVCKTEISRTAKTIDQLTTHTDANSDDICDVCGASLKQAVTHTVTVVNGTGSGEYAVGSTVSIHAASSEANQVFSGWTGLEGLTLTLGTAESEDISFLMPDKDVKLAAVFKAPAVATYTVSFLANGGSGEMEAATGISGLYTLPVCGFTAPNGKIFKGWALEQDGEVLNTPYLVGADMTLYAIWADAPKPQFTAPTVAALVEVNEGENGTMTVAANDATAYQWYINRNDGRGYVKIDGAVGSSYVTSAVQPENDGYTYYCVASNAYAATQSATFTLKVKAVLPKTGDGAPLAAWCALLAASAIGMMVIRRKRA